MIKCSFQFVGLSTKVTIKIFKYAATVDDKVRRSTLFCFYNKFLSLAQIKIYQMLLYPNTNIFYFLRDSLAAQLVIY